MDAPETASGNGKDKETVKVVVRCRPLFGKELVEGRKSIVTLDQAAALISLKCPENGQLKSFTFDSVYDEKTSQRQFYDESGYPLVESIFDGYNGTIFAYGQTGCGKTHTMQGQESPSDLRGVIPLSFDHIFDTINADTTREYMVRASYLEIYNEDIRDLLSDDTKKRLDLKEAADGTVYVKDLTEVVVRNVQSMNNVMSRGFKNRTVGATLMNEGSSRSHSIFSVVVETSETIGGQDHFKAGKLNLVDLAGSERQSKTGATGSRLKEGCKINLSLSALGNVISALVDGKGKHIPYRDSKLTRLLQDSLGGNTKTLMVAAVSPADYNYDETLSTLRYANRAKNIKNKPIVNEDPKDAKLREYKEEIERLRTMLASQSQPRDDILTTFNVTNVSGRTVITTRQEVEKSQQDAAEMLKQATVMMEEAKALQAQNQRMWQEGAGDSEGTVVKANGTGVVANLLPLLDRCTDAEQTSSPEPLEKSKILLLAEPDSAKQQVMQEADAQAKEMMAKAEKLMREATERQLASQAEVVVKEVVSDAHIKEREELRELNQTIVNQRDRIGQELEQTQVAMEKFMREKDALHAKLRKIESHILGGTSGLSTIHGSGNTQDADSEVTLLKQQVEFRRTQIKLREKVKLQAKNEAMRRALELEKQQVEEELKTAQETAQASVAAARKKELKYKARLEASRQEVVDLNSEFEQERENMLDTIREQTKEAKLLEQLVDLFLPQHELVKVWERAVWSEERKEWNLPKIKARHDFHLIKLPTLKSSGGDETGGAEVVSDDDTKDRQGTTGSIGSCTVRSSVSAAGSERRKSGTFRQPSRANANTPYDDVYMETHTHLSSLRNDAQHISRLNSKVADLAARGMSPHNTLNGTKDRRKHKDKSVEASGLEKTKLVCKPEEELVGQVASVYKASRDDLSFQREDGFVVEDHPPRDRLQSRHGLRPDSRQEAKTRCANSSGTSSALGQLETTPPPLVPSSAPIKSSSRAESRGRHHRRRDQQQADEVGNDEWIGASTTGLPPFSKKKGKHTKKKKERRTKTELQVDDASLDFVTDHVSLRSFRSSNDTL